MVTIPRLAPGNEVGFGAGWFPYNNTADTKMVGLRCECGLRMTLSFNPPHHQIDAAGNVHPSMICTPQPGCGWHVHGRLADWNFGAMPCRS